MQAVKLILRNVIPLVLAIGIALALFWFMQWLIEPDIHEPTEQVRGSMQRVDLAPEKQNTPTPQTASEAPPPPTALAATAAALPVAPALSRPTAPSAELSFTPTAMPGLSINTSNVGIQALAAEGLDITVGNVPTAGNIQVADFKTADEFRGRRVVPISTRTPCFPTPAFNRKVEGSVDVVFVVQSNGRVLNPRVVSATPKGFFEVEAVEAVRTWIYDKKLLRGAAIEVLQTIPFTLDMYIPGINPC